MVDRNRAVRLQIELLRRLRLSAITFTSPDAVMQMLAAWVRETGPETVHDLLPEHGLNLCTLFLDTPDTGPDALVWYLEVWDEQMAPWRDPVAAVQSAPVFERGLTDLLDGTPTVRAAGVDGHQRGIVATHPHRQTWYEAAGGQGVVAPVAGDTLPVEVAMVAVSLRAGVVSWLTSRVLGMVNWLKRHTTLFERFQDDVEILTEERMFSESLLLGPATSGASRQRVMYYYMETEEMARLYDAFDASNDWKARLSKWLFARVFDEPEVLLEPPLESAYTVLIHAVDPERC